jgi:phosphatidylserine/phosphatidylglycerophosphate/cardiolipin synthase-like enzyme
MPTQDPKSPDSASLSSPQVFAAFNDAEDSPEPEVKAPATSLTGIIGTAIQQETKARPNQPLQMSIDLEETEAEYQHCDCQVLRSISEWSVGIPTPETSIYKAYITLIRESEHFIYIENQYFISSIDLPAPKNRIAEAIYKRCDINFTQAHVYSSTYEFTTESSGPL